MGKPTFCKLCKVIHPEGKHTIPLPASKDDQRRTAFREVWAAADAAERRLRALCMLLKQENEYTDWHQAGLSDADALRKALTDWKGMA